MMVNSDITKKPVINESDYFSLNNNIKIEKGDGHFQSRGSYVISVEPIKYFYDRFSSSSYEYRILVDTNVEVLVQENMASYFDLDSGQTMYFKTIVDKSSTIEISTTVDLYNSTVLYVSLQRKN